MRATAYLHPATRPTVGIYLTWALTFLLVPFCWAAGVDIDKRIFDKDNIDNLCVEEGDAYVVKRSDLAWALVRENRAIKSLEMLNRVLKIMPRVPGGDEKNLFFFVYTSDLDGIGPNYSEDERKRKEEKEILDQQSTINDEFKQWLRGIHGTNKNFELSGTEVPTPKQYFLEPAKYSIVCKGKKKEGEGSADNGAWLKNVVVRKSLADLSVGGNDLKKANGAQLSYTDDEIKSRKTLAIEGLVGYVIAGDGASDRTRVQAGVARTQETQREDRDLYWYKVVPYIYYKNSTTQPASAKDTEYVTPGVAATWTWVSRTGAFAFDLQFDASATLDAAHDSQVYNLGVRFEPSFHFGQGKGLFNGWTSVGGGFLVARQDLALVAREFIVDTAGTNPELAGLSTYTGLGYDFMAQAYLDTTVPVLSNLIAKYTHSYRYNTGSVADIWRNTFTVSYVLSDSTTIDFDYTTGRDLNTLQEEQLWKAALTFRN